MIYINILLSILTLHTNPTRAERKVHVYLLKWHFLSGNYFSPTFTRYPNKPILSLSLCLPLSLSLSLSLSLFLSFGRSFIQSPLVVLNRSLTRMHNLPLRYNSVAFSYLFSRLLIVIYIYICVCVCVCVCVCTYVCVCVSVCGERERKWE